MNFERACRQNIRVQSYLVVHLGLQLSVLGLDGAQLLLQRLHPLLQLAVLRLDGVELTHERAVPGKVVLEVPGGVLRLLGLFVERDQGLVNKVEFLKSVSLTFSLYGNKTCFRLLELHSLRSTLFRLLQSHVGRARRSTTRFLRLDEEGIIDGFAPILVYGRPYSRRRELEAPTKITTNAGL